MLTVRFHPDGFDTPAMGGARGTGDDSPTGGRLNLLLSYAGWREDPWVDRLPMLLEPMGVRSLTAGSGQEAARFIQSHPIHIAVVDLAISLDGQAGCPGCDEGGPRLFDLLRRLDAPPPTVVVKRGRTERDDRREIAAALKAGAFAVLDRPHDTRGIEAMLSVLGRVLARHYAGRWPGGFDS